MTMTLSARRGLLAALLFASTGVHTASAGETPILPGDVDAIAAHYSAHIISRYFLPPSKLDDAMSASIFDGFLQSLDPGRSFLTQADVDQFSAFRTTLDDAIERRDLRTPYAMFNAFRQRAGERSLYVREHIAQAPDFTLQEQLPGARAIPPWAGSTGELQDRWRRQIKYEWLQLRLTGATDAQIMAALQRRNDDAIAQVRKLGHGDVLRMFLNAYGEAVGNSNTYLKPEQVNAPDDSGVTGTGAGARWHMQDGFVTLLDLDKNSLAGSARPGGGVLNAGDRIVAIGTPMEAVLGWPLGDTVARLRGAPGSSVILDILPVEAGLTGKHRQVSIQRGVADNRAASKAILTLAQNGRPHKVGVITLSRFYQDVEARRAGKPYKSSARDVAELLQSLKADGVDNIVLDLRDNEGGPLIEATTLAELFIGKAPLGRVVDAKGAGEVIGNSRDAPAPWQGLLGVLISHKSAAGAEIFAAAIQDYGRGLVLGETSFGTGAVHAVINLDQIASPPNAHYGALRVPVNQFYRVSGKAIQLRGVVPDIGFAVRIDASSVGESLKAHPLAWGERPALDYTPRGELGAIVPQLQAKHVARLKSDAALRSLQQLAQRFEQQGARKTITLNEGEMRQEIDDFQRQLGAAPGPAGMDFDGAVLKESARILLDEAELIAGDAALAMRVRPATSAAATRAP